MVVIYMDSRVSASTQLYLRAMESVEYLSPPGSDESVSGESVCEIFAKNSICFTRSEAISEVDVTEFVKKQGTPTASDVISLFIHIKFDTLPEELRESLYEMVKERARHTEDDKYMLPFTTVRITAEKN